MKILRDILEDARQDEIDDLDKQMAELKKSEVTWADVEDGKAQNKDYRKWRRQMAKLSDRSTSLWVDKQHEEREAKHTRRKGTSTDPKLQKYADKYHELTCGWDHTERCGYHYGNWKDDVRSEMLDAYESVEKYIKKFGRRGFTNRLNILDKAEQAKKDLTS